VSGSRESPLDPAGFAALTGVSRETLMRLEAYAELLRRWSGTINLVGRDTLPDLWRRHFLDSAQLLGFVPPAAGSLVDLGSGAGFPGLVLAILGAPGVELIESDARRAAFLREVARITKTRIAIHTARVEAVPPHPVDVITARACAPLERLIMLSQRFIGSNTRCLFLKGARVDEELTAARAAWKMTALRHRSRTDPRGVVLILDRVAREPRQR